MSQITRNKRCKNALEVRNFITEMETEYGTDLLQRAYVVGLYSDDIEGGECDATFVVDPSDEDHTPYLEVVGGSEMV